MFYNYPFATLTESRGKTIYDSQTMTHVEWMREFRIQSHNGEIEKLAGEISDG